MAVLLDIGEKDNGHPGNKKDVGKRLALLALKMITIIMLFLLAHYMKITQ